MQYSLLGAGLKGLSRFGPQDFGCSVVIFAHEYHYFAEIARPRPGLGAAPAAAGTAR